jgi:hypothetical protein
LSRERVRFQQIAAISYEGSSGEGRVHFLA